MTMSPKADKDNSKVCFLNETLKESFYQVIRCIINTLDWGYHVHKIAKRAGQHLGLLRKAKKSTSTNCTWDAL